MFRKVKCTVYCDRIFHHILTICYCLLSLLPTIFILIHKSFCCFSVVPLSCLQFTLELFPSLRQDYIAPILSPSTGMGNIMSEHLVMSFLHNLLIQIKYWKVMQHESSSHDRDCKGLDVFHSVLFFPLLNSISTPILSQSSPPPLKAEPFMCPSEQCSVSHLVTKGK